MTPGGLPAATDALERLLNQLDAVRVSAYWQTAHGVVELTVPGPHVLVNGEEVPRHGRG